MPTPARHGSSPPGWTLIRPCNPWHEIAVVLVLLLHLGLIAAMRADALTDRSTTIRAISEVAMEELSDPARDVVRALRAAAGDVVGPVRAGGTWPEPTRLAAGLVPPFDARLLPPQLRSLHFVIADQGPAWVDYLGSSEPSDTILGAYVLRVIDRNATIDPFHHPHPHQPRRSADDPRFEVQVWFHPEPSAAHGGVDLRPGGWRRVIDGVPS